MQSIALIQSPIIDFQGLLIYAYIWGKNMIPLANFIFQTSGLGERSVCDLSCLGDSTQICGGLWANSVYTIPGKYSNNRSTGNLLISSILQAYYCEHVILIVCVQNTWLQFAFQWNSFNFCLTIKNMDLIYMIQDQ